MTDVVNEIRLQMYAYISESVDHWSVVPGINEKGRCNGVACSMLIMLDGGFSLYPITIMSMAEDGAEIVVNKDSLLDGFHAYLQEKGGLT